MKTYEIRKAGLGSRVHFARYWPFVWVCRGLCLCDVMDLLESRRYVPPPPPSPPSDLTMLTPLPCPPPKNQ